MIEVRELSRKWENCAADNLYQIQKAGLKTKLSTQKIVSLKFTGKTLITNAE